MRREIAVKVFLLMSLSLAAYSFAHEGHHHSGAVEQVATVFGSSGEGINWQEVLKRVGGFHFLFLHFPIALIFMTVVAELLWIIFKNPVFDHAARFMLLAAAIFAIPTALLGLALGSTSHYEEGHLVLYVWHRAFGLSTAILAVVAAVLREGYTRKIFHSLTGYYIALVILFILVTLTGTFGGEMTFGTAA